MQPNSASTPSAPSRRIVVVPLIRNHRGRILLCRMPPDRGVFPGKWGLAGGGIEAGETMVEALRREVREELGLEIDEIQPLFFSDGRHWKSFSDGRREEIYMIFLIFECQAVGETITLNSEFDAYAWVDRESLVDYDLNEATIQTLSRAGYLKTPSSSSSA